MDVTRGGWQYARPRPLCVSRGHTHTPVRTLALSAHVMVYYHTHTRQYLEWRMRDVYKRGDVCQTSHAFPMEPVVATAAAPPRGGPSPTSAVVGKTKFVEFLPSSNALVALSGVCVSEMYFMCVCARMRGTGKIVPVVSLCVCSIIYSC